MVGSAAVLGQAGAGNGAVGSAGGERGEQATSGQYVDPLPGVNALASEAAAEGLRGGAEGVKGDRERVGPRGDRQRLLVEQDGRLDAELVQLASCAPDP